MPKKSRKEKDEPAVDLPEEQTENTNEEEAKDTEEKAPGDSDESRNGNQDEEAKDTPHPETSEEKLSQDDLLAEVRQTLVSSEDVEEPKGFFGRIWNRFGKRSGSEDDKKAQELREDKAELEAALDELTAERKPGKKTRASRKEEEAIQEFFSDLEALSSIDGADAKLDALEEKIAPPAEEKPAKKAELPRLPRKSEKQEDDLDKIRDLALQEYDDTKIEPTQAPPKHLQDEVRETIRESRPLERILLIAGVVVTVVVLLFSGGYLIANSITVPTPAPTATLDLANVTYPIRITLPGGWEFPLGQGKVVDGVWSPQGAEWLVGTEISRWVALPWTVQLEAVVRTFKSGDQIELMMSNSDILVYGVHSIQQMTMEELLALDSKSPNLVVVLYANEGSEDGYWVATALPEGLKDE